jgi:predicted metallopeptidase
VPCESTRIAKFLDDTDSADMDSHGFDFTANVRRVVQSMVQGLDELNHIDVQRIAFSFGQARKRTRHGIYASLTPMRFQGGSLTTARRGEQFTVQRLFSKSGQEMLYILTFYLPRFMDVEFNEKLITVLHELWHISPEFDGDLRRHPGRCYVHTQSQAEYDAHMQVLADRWLAQNPPGDAIEFLQSSFVELHRRHGRVFGTRVPHPKLIRVSELQLHR